MAPVQNFLAYIQSTAEASLRQWVRLTRCRAAEAAGRCPDHLSVPPCRTVPKFMKRSKVPDYRDKAVFGVPPIINVQRTGQPLPQSIQQAMRYLRSQCLDQVRPLAPRLGVLPGCSFCSAVAGGKASFEGSPRAALGRDKGGGRGGLWELHIYRCLLGCLLAGLASGCGAARHGAGPALPRVPAWLPLPLRSAFSGNRG